MVLGAHLFPVKSGSTANIVIQGKNLSRTHFNATEAYNLVVNRGKGREVGFNEEVVKNTLNLTQKDEIEAPRSPQELERVLAHKCKDSMQRYIYLRVISFEHFTQIFSKAEVETDLLLILCRTFREQVIDNAAFNTEEEQEYIS